MMGFAYLTPDPVTMLAGDACYSEDLFEAPEAWPVVREASGEALSAKVGDFLEQGPVFLVPPWERQADTSLIGGGRRVFYAYEDVLRACRPTGAESVMAVLTPM